MIRILPSWRYEDGINFCPLFYLKSASEKDPVFPVNEPPHKISLRVAFVT